jgi:4-diphosphocytidyl-2-C-methyl-D-erythritol kinase
VHYFFENEFMIQFPNAKINIGLNIVAKRPDGYHDIESIFYPIPLYDALEFVESSSLQFSPSGKMIDGQEADNLVLKAYHLLKNDFESLPPIHIYIHKVIPMGAGLGGGSSNASFMLMMLNKHFELEISKDKLLDYAAQLGSDCPFFIHNIPSYAEGRGEQLTPIALDLSKYFFLLIKPKIHVSTAWAFSEITPKVLDFSCKEIINLPLKEWKNCIVNDFEEPIFLAQPVLTTIKEKLYSLGALYASMSGSGSVIYGIFEEKPTWENEWEGCEVFLLKEK